MQRFTVQVEGLVDMNLAEVGRGSYVVRAIGQVLNFKANVFVNNCLFTLECFQLLFAVLYRKWVLHSKFRELFSYCLGEGQERGYWASAPYGLQRLRCGI